MKDLLSYLIENILGKKDFEIEESGEDDAVTLRIIAEPDDMGLIIGKNGNIIKAIQTLVRVRGRLEKKNVYVNIEAKVS